MANFEIMGAMMVRRWEEKIQQVGEWIGEKDEDDENADKDDKLGQESRPVGELAREWKE